MFTFSKWKPVQPSSGSSSSSLHYTFTLSVAHCCPKGRAEVGGVGWNLALAVRADVEQQEEHDEFVEEQEQKVATATASWLATSEAELEAAVMLVGPVGLISVEEEGVD